MIKRCATCVMPETEGHIALDNQGICNICSKSRSQQQPGPPPVQGGLDALRKKIQDTTSAASGACNALIALSGGKDSTMALYVAVTKLQLRPLAVFIDNGFCTEAMYRNVRNATEKLSVDLLIYAPQLIKKLFKHLLLSRIQVYYCRICNALIDYYLRVIALQHGIPLLITGLTKGQEFLRGTEMFWIYRASDANLLQSIAGHPEFKLVADMFASLALYFHKHFSSITQVAPFHYIGYQEQEILSVLTNKLGYTLPEVSWPQGSTNCLFNFVTQSLTVSYFGYSQHEAEISALVRNGEMIRERALEIIESPFSEAEINLALAKLNLTYKDIV
jgi:hypothetical protein